MAEVKTAKFVGSFTRNDKCPTDGKPEYAFIGRSNVGKSSLINMLCAQKDLAKVSQTPGKTQLINFFDINETWYMVDLPGYGYARASRTLREAWEKMIWYYLKNRETLQYVFVLVDSMIPPQANDLEFINKLGEYRVPFVVAYTKTDRMKADDVKRNMGKFRAAMLETWSAMPPEFVTSAERGRGKNEILTFVEKANLEYRTAN